MMQRKPGNLNISITKVASITGIQLPMIILRLQLNGNSFLTGMTWNHFRLLKKEWNGIINMQPNFR